eukprot:5788841-Ditylum_brightwellii.AAC.1
MELQVELPMILEVDNRGAVDMANNWSAGGRAWHIQTCMSFQRNLQEAKLVKRVNLSEGECWVSTWDFTLGLLYAGLGMTIGKAWALWEQAFVPIV